MQSYILNAILSRGTQVCHAYTWGHTEPQKTYNTYTQCLVIALRQWDSVNAKGTGWGRAAEWWRWKEERRARMREEKRDGSRGVVEGWEEDKEEQRQRLNKEMAWIHTHTHKKNMLVEWTLQFFNATHWNIAKQIKATIFESGSDLKFPSLPQQHVLINISRAKQFLKDGEKKSEGKTEHEKEDGMDREGGGGGWRKRVKGWDGRMEEGPSGVLRQCNEAGNWGEGRAERDWSIHLINQLLAVTTKLLI